MKDIPGYEGLYAVTRDGRVWSYPKLGGRLNGLWIKVGKHRKGYLVYFLAKNKVKKTCFAHRLVALTHIPNSEGFSEVNHINSDKTDNCVENLEWCSRKRNMKHAADAGRLYLPRFEEHHQAKLTKEKVLDIRARYAKGGVKQRDLAKEFGVNQRAIWSIIHRETWNF